MTDKSRIEIWLEYVNIWEAAEAMATALGQLDKWFDTDDEIIAAMSHDERVDHIHQHETIRAALAAHHKATCVTGREDDDGL